MKEIVLDKQCKTSQARGRRGRTAALFATGGGGTDYFQWGINNGLLRIAKQNPVPLTPGKPLATYDNVYWPLPHFPAGNLDERRTLELRMDLNHTSADDLFLALICLGRSDAGETGYEVFVDRNEVALVKVSSAITSFYWDTLSTTNENVTVKLAFSKTNSSLAITVKIVDKGGQRATLYERTFVDGPGQDGPLVPPDPHGLGIFKRDPGVPHPDFFYVAVGCSQMIYTTPPPLEMLLDNLEYDISYPEGYQPPQLGSAPTTNGMDLNWPLPTLEQTVVEADQLPGPWSLCPQPCTRTGDAFCLQMPCLAPRNFFKLTPGIQFMDDFSSGTNAYWNVWAKPQHEVTVTNGVLRTRIQGPMQGAGIALCPPSHPVTVNEFYSSVDILSWTTSANNWSGIRLVARDRFMGPSAGEGYMGGLILNPPTGVPGDIESQIYRAQIGNEKIYNHGSKFNIATYPPPYRLEFAGVGSNLTVRVLSLTTQAVIQQMTVSDTTFAGGVVGLFVNMPENVAASQEVILDNYFVTGTKP